MPAIIRPQGAFRYGLRRIVRGTFVLAYPVTLMPYLLWAFWLGLCWLTSR